MSTLVGATSLWLCLALAAGGRLPPPGWRIPDAPRLQPSVVTAAGRRLLLGYTRVRVRWDAEKKRLTCDRPGWWLINYPLDRIEGLEGLLPAERALRVLGAAPGQVRNWFLYVPRAPAAEPPEPTGPAPLALHPRPKFVVGPGRSLSSIQAAVNRARPGDVIRVLPGVYRESVTFPRGGKPGAPIVLEGARDAQGRLPVITGNDPFPPRAWRPVPGAPGVYRAKPPAGLAGTVACDGRALVERSWCGELQPGEWCFNRGSKEANRLRVEPTARPREGDALDGLRWRRVAVDADGFLDLSKLPGGAAPNSVYYACAYVWVEPKKISEKWDPRFPQPVTRRVDAPGDFRAGRQTGSSLKSQLNFYRVWCNGERIPSAVFITPAARPIPPRPTRNYGRGGDRIEDFPLRQGWNRLLFQFDTTRRPKRVRFKLLAPKGIGTFVSSASPPASAGARPAGRPAAYVSEYLLLGPFRSEPDEAVYVRLPGDRDPNSAAMDMAARCAPLVTCEHDYVEFRGFEVRHGAAFQQRPLVAFTAAGGLVEGCWIHDSEVGGLKLSNPHDQRAPALVARNNWIERTGGAGLTAQHSSKQLTPDNETDPAPGRGRLLIEYNVIRLTNWAGHPPFWESGGMKLFRLTGAVVRYNDIADCFGPGIWLDWEHYNNRLEGNLIHNNWSFGIGIEASPGPNLVANNLFVGMRPGRVWFRWNILDWSTGRTLAVNNTIDGQWRQDPCWFGRKGTGGIFLGREGGPDRHTRWPPLKKDRGAAAVNNLIVGCARAIHPRPPQTCAANYTDRGKGAAPSRPAPTFLHCSPFDYRLPAGHSLTRLGVENRFTRFVRRDFYGLPRPPGERAVGAFRSPLRPWPPSGPVVQVELADGSVKTRR